MEAALRSAIDALAFAVEIAAAVIVAAAALQAWLLAVAAWIRASPGSIEATRLGLGRRLSLAIEFELAADIIRTTVSPTWSQLGKLAAIVAIRSIINHFLQREIERANP